MRLTSLSRVPSTTHSLNTSFLSFPLLSLISCSFLLLSFLQYPSLTPLSFTSPLSLPSVFLLPPLFSLSPLFSLPFFQPSLHSSPSVSRLHSVPLSPFSSHSSAVFSSPLSLTFYLFPFLFPPTTFLLYLLVIIVSLFSLSLSQLSFLFSTFIFLIFLFLLSLLFSFLSSTLQFVVFSSSTLFLCSPSLLSFVISFISVVSYSSPSFLSSFSFYLLNSPLSCSVVSFLCLLLFSIHPSILLSLPLSFFLINSGDRLIDFFVSTHPLSFSLSSRHPSLSPSFSAVNQ